MSSDVAGNGTLKKTADGAEAVDEPSNSGRGASISGAETRGDGAAQHGIASGVCGAVESDEDELRQPKRKKSDERGEGEAEERAESDEDGVNDAAKDVAVQARVDQDS